MPPMNAGNFIRRVRRPPGQRRTVRLHIVAGPGAGTVQEIAVPESSRFGSYIPGASWLSRASDVDDDDLGTAVPYYDALPTVAGHGRPSKRARVAATSEDVMGLPEVAGRSRSGEECAVCLQDFGADDKLRAMPCSHAFHQHCISEWLRRKAVCPLCRHRMHTKDDDEQPQDIHWRIHDDGEHEQPQDIHWRIDDDDDDDEQITS